MSSEQYWIGKNIDLDSLWHGFDSGQGYISKFESVEPYLLRLTFDRHPIHLPLFDAEVIYKTVKGTFHDIKAERLSPKEYDEASPIFLYQINRGSGIFEFLGQFYPLLTYISALGAAMMYYRSSLEKDANQALNEFVSHDEAHSYEEHLDIELSKARKCLKTLVACSKADLRLKRRWFGWFQTNT